MRSRSAPIRRTSPLTASCSSRGRTGRTPNFIETHPRGRCCQATSLPGRASSRVLLPPHHCCCSDGDLSDHPRSDRCTERKCQPSARRLALEDCTETRQPMLPPAFSKGQHRSVKAAAGTAQASRSCTPKASTDQIAANSIRRVTMPASGTSEKCQNGRSTRMVQTKPDQPRIPVHAGDPPEVFEAEAKLLVAYSSAIALAVSAIVEKFPDPDDQTLAAKAYVAKIGSEIPDSTIEAAVKRLAASKFRLCGIEV
jgi:hypothetical protein